MEGKGEMVAEAEIERLPVDLLAHIFSLLSSFRDLAQASGACRKWRRGVEQSLASREWLSFSRWKMDDASTARLVCAASNLKELDISRSCWGCQITDEGLYKISFAKCVSNLTSISLWGIAGITDAGVIQLVSRAMSLQNLNIGGTFITDESLYAIANCCPQLKEYRSKLLSISRQKKLFIHWHITYNLLSESKTISLWSCRHVTESGLNTLVNKCRRLQSINVWGMRVPVESFIGLLSISPALQIKPISHHLNLGNQWPVA